MRISTPIESIAEYLQVAFEAWAKKVALPMRGGPDFLDSQTRSISEPHPIG